MKKRWFALCMCIVMLAGILTSCGTNTGKIKFGAAGLGGTYRVFGDTFANLVTSKNKKYKMEVKTTAGSAANLRLLSDGYIQMAVAQTDLTNDAYERTGIFENEKQHGGYSAVAALYTEACQIVVKAFQHPDRIHLMLQEIKGQKYIIRPFCPDHMIHTFRKIPDHVQPVFSGNLHQISFMLNSIGFHRETGQNL